MFSGSIVGACDRVDRNAFQKICSNDVISLNVYLSTLSICLYHNNQTDKLKVTKEYTNVLRPTFVRVSRLANRSM